MLKLPALGHCYLIKLNSLLVFHTLWRQLFLWFCDKKSYQIFQFLRCCCTFKWVFNSSDLRIFAVQVRLGIDRGVPVSQQQFHYLCVSSFLVPCRLFPVLFSWSFPASVDKGAFRKSHLLNIDWNISKSWRLWNKWYLNFRTLLGPYLEIFLIGTLKKAL